MKEIPFQADGLFISPHQFESRDQIMDKLSVPETHTVFSYESATEFLKEAQALSRESHIGVEEAVYEPKTQYPDLPLCVLLATDMHYGSIGTDYNLLESHLSIVQNTPNFSMITNGDHIDNFNATGKLASAMFENPLPPSLQTKAFIERIKRIDQLDKLGVMSFGNHEGFLNPAGYDWLETFAVGMKASIFTKGGLLHILYGEQHYMIALTHKFWGSSKLNPTNACKRFMDFEYPHADIAFLGHTHQAEALYFEKSGKKKIGVIGGTYKILDDRWAAQQGIGRHPGTGGMCVALYPHEKRMVLADIETLQEFVQQRA